MRAPSADGAIGARGGAGRLRELRIGLLVGRETSRSTVASQPVSDSAPFSDAAPSSARPPSRTSSKQSSVRLRLVTTAWTLCCASERGGLALRHDPGHPLQIHGSDDRDRWDELARVVLASDGVIHGPPIVVAVSSR